MVFIINSLKIKKIYKDSECEFLLQNYKVYKAKVQMEWKKREN